MSRTFSERLVYVQFTSCVYWVIRFFCILLTKFFPFQNPKYPLLASGRNLIAPESQYYMKFKKKQQNIEYWNLQVNIFKVQKQPPDLFHRNIHRKTPVLENEVADLQSCNFNKKRLQDRCFPLNIAKFVTTPISRSICERLPLKVW